MASTRPTEDLRLVILDTAEQLIAEKGVADTSLADISNASGISRGTLYYYYRAKSDLLIDTVERHMNEVTEKIIFSINNNLSLKLEDAISLVLKTITSDDSRSRMHSHLLSEAFNGNNEIRERIAASYMKWKSSIRTELIKRGVPDKRSSIAADLIISTIDGLVIQKLLGVLKNKPEDVTAIIAKGLI